MTVPGSAAGLPELPDPAVLLDLAGGRAAVARWWRPAPHILGVLTGAADADAPNLGERIAAEPGWGGRPVVLAGAEPAPGWFAQLLADQVQVPVITAAAQPGPIGWYGIWPRTTTGGTRLPTLLGGSFPVPKSTIADTAAAIVPVPVAAAPTPPCPAAGDAAMPGAAEDEAAWQLSARPAGIASPLGAYLVLLDPSEEPRRPFLLGDEPATCWQVATALWTARDRWAGRALALDPPGIPGAHAQLLANYLGVEVWHADANAGWRVRLPRAPATQAHEVDELLLDSVRYITDLAELLDDPAPPRPPEPHRGDR